MLLLLAAQVGESDEGMINAGYVAKLMSQDWGFYYTAKTNLERISSAVEGVKALDEAQRGKIREQAALLRKHIEEAPKSWGWKNRAKVGTRKIWYKEVSDWM